MKKFILMLLIAAILTGCITGCGAVNTDDLMDNVTPNEPGTFTDLSSGSGAMMDFGLRLFRESQKEGKNALVSPLSVLCALAMTANGADGETLAQMEQVLGSSIDDLNRWLHGYMAQLPASGKNVLHIANSIWFRDDPQLTVEQEFLQTNADYYGAGIFKAPFDDSTKRDINNWVKQNTDGMIRDILDEIPEDAMLYLVNALSFEAEWQNIYCEHQIRDAVFTTEDGKSQDVEMMYSGEYCYLEDENAAGFLKYYDGREYAFLALLPDEGVSVEEYLETLTGEDLAAMLDNMQQVQVNAGIPKFKAKYGVEMSETLKGMGMPDAFDPICADLSRMASSTGGNLYVNRVLHKAAITLDEKGTKAGAATAVEVNRESAAEPPEEIKTVILDRPFVYMLIDCKTNVPFFIGTMMDVNGG